MKTLFTLILTLSLSLAAPAQTTPKKIIAANCEGRGCNGSEYCTACMNCSGCKHCAKQGGNCGVCAPKKRQDASAPKKGKKATARKKKK